MVSQYDLTLLLLFCGVFLFLVCSGQNVVLLTDAPLSSSGNVFSGVFARSENVSFLLPASDKFLPVCFHTSVQPLNLTISQVNHGPIWVQEAAFPTFPSRLLPLSPPLLQPNLTGLYECTAPGQNPSRQKYCLEVVGKKGSKFEHFLLGGRGRRGCVNPIIFAFTIWTRSSKQCFFNTRTV